MEPVSLGQRCYETYAAYLQSHGYISGPWPPWEDLGPMQRAGYEAAAAAVCSAAVAVSGSVVANPSWLQPI